MAARHRITKTAPLILVILMGHIFIPLMFIMHLRDASWNDTVAWVLSLFVAASYIAFISLTGAWSWFGRATRALLWALLAAAAVAFFPAEHAGGREATLLEDMLSLCIGGIFTALAVWAFLGSRLKVRGLDLGFPLQGGTYAVAQGGSTSIVNIHRASPSQLYALDLLKLNTMGVRAAGLYPAALERYAIFGAEVLSPCDGVISAAEDGFTDLSPPERDPEHRAGNYIAIEVNGATIYLAHLMKGSLFVRPGDRVSRGQVLGRIGNSGNTTEPHLHIHAEEGPYPGQFSGRPGLPIRFNGRFLVRNDRVKAAGPGTKSVSSQNQLPLRREQ